MKRFCLSEYACLENAHLPLSAAEMPIAADEVIANLLKGDLRERWRRWLAAPRYRVRGETVLGRCLIVTLQAPVPTDQLWADGCWDLADALAVGHGGELLTYVDAAADSADLMPFFVSAPEIAACQHDDAAVDALVASDRWRLAVGTQAFATVPLPFGRTALSFDMEMQELLEAAASSSSDAERIVKDVRRGIKRRERRLHLAVARWLRAALDEGTRNALREAGVPQTGATYNWIVTAPSASSRERRCQALAAYPGLIMHMLSVPADAEARAAMTNCVDSADSLSAYFCDAFGIREALLKRLRPVGYCRLFDRPTSRLKVFFQQLEAIQPAYWPGDAATLERAFEAAECCEYFADTAGMHVPGGPARMMTAGGVVAREFDRVARRGWVLARDDGFGWKFVHEVGDVVGSMLRATGGESGRYEHQEGKPPAMLPEALHGIVDWSVPHWERVSRRWHAARAQLGEAILEAPPGFEWPALLPPTVFGDRVVWFLTTPSQLEQEGARMGHCVGSRVDDCLFGCSHIARLENVDGEPQSTVQLTIWVDEFEPVRLDEHRGFENADPSPECTAALAALIARLEQPDMEARFRALAGQTEERRIRQAEWDASVGEARRRIERAALKAAMPDWPFDDDE